MQETAPSAAQRSCVRAIPCLASTGTTASRTAARLAYLFLKNGLVVSNFGFDMSSCAFASAVAISFSSLIGVLRSEIIQAVRLTRYVIQVLLVLCPPVVFLVGLE